MTNVGGDPSEMTGGAATVHAAGVALEHLESPVDDRLRSLADNAGDHRLVDATRRFSAAFGTVVGHSGTQAVVAAQLAANAATDLVEATGGGA